MQFRGLVFQFQIGLVEGQLDSATPASVLGYIIGANKNDKVPTVTVRESAAEVTIGRERVVVGDEPEFHAGRKDKYRR